MGKRFVPKAKFGAAGPARTIRAESDVHVCTRKIVTLSDNYGAKAVLFRLARRCVKMPDVAAGFAFNTSFSLTASDIVHSVWNTMYAEKATGLSERQLEQFAIGYQTLTNEPLPKDRAALEKLRYDHMYNQRPSYGSRRY